MPAASFRVYQDNALKCKHNDELTRSRRRRLEEAGAFRAPTNAARSFQPQYGGGAGRGFLRFDDGAGQRWFGDFAEACAPGASRVRGAQGAADPATGAAGGQAT